MREEDVLSQPHPSVDPYTSPASAPDLRNRSTETKKLIGNIAFWVVMTGFVLFVLFALDVVDLTYTHYVDNEPLSKPVLVASKTTDQIVLADGRVLAELYATDRLDWSLKNADKLIELQPSESSVDRVEIYAKEFNFICGISVGFNLVKIPLIPFKQNRYRRVHVGDALCVPQLQSAVDQNQDASRSDS
jgi:hypothetical protein